MDIMRVPPFFVNDASSVDIEYVQPDGPAACDTAMV
jgi:hypothetical protein